MKRFSKLLRCFLSALMILSLLGCGKDGESILDGADEETNSMVSDNIASDEVKTTVGDLGKSVSYVLTEEQAQKKAYEELKKECDNGTYSDIESFAFYTAELKGSDEGCAAFNRGYGSTSKTENFSGHAYYSVIYMDTDEIAGHAYICIDAVNGDVLYSGYSGD